MLRLLLFVTAVFAVGYAGCSPVLAGGDDDDDDSAVSALSAVNGIAWSRMVVKVVDAEGRPIAGAVVRPWALRAGNGHGLWTEDAFGAPKRTRTDAAGQSEVVFPQSSKWRD